MRRFRSDADRPMKGLDGFFIVAPMCHEMLLASADELEARLTTAGALCARYRALREVLHDVVSRAKIAKACCGMC